MLKLSPPARRYLGLGFVVAVVLLLGTVPATANPGGTGLVISQVYGGGGNTDAQYTNDFIEIFNPTAAAVSVSGWSVQYGSTAGTSWTNQTNLTGSRTRRAATTSCRRAQGPATASPLPTPERHRRDRDGGRRRQGRARQHHDGAHAARAVRWPQAWSTSSATADATNCFEGDAGSDALEHHRRDCAARRGARTRTSTAPTSRPRPPRRGTAPRRRTSCPTATRPSRSTTSRRARATPARRRSRSPSASPRRPEPAASPSTSRRRTARAAQPGDYTAKSLTGQTISAGNSTYTFDVLVNGDTSSSRTRRSSSTSPT